MVPQYCAGWPAFCLQCSYQKKTCHPCISKASTFVQETVDVGESRHRLPRRRTAPVHPVVISTGAQLRDRCPSHARPDSRKTSHRIYKAGYRDPSHLWSGYFIAIVRRAHQPRRPGAPSVPQRYRGMGGKAPSSMGCVHQSEPGAVYFGASIRTSKMSWLAISIGIWSVSVTAFPVQRSFPSCAPFSPNFAKSRWNGCVE
jgi:hypothetical protein